MPAAVNMKVFSGTDTARELKEGVCVPQHVLCAAPLQVSTCEVYMCVHVYVCVRVCVQKPSVLSIGIRTQHVMQL